MKEIIAWILLAIAGIGGLYAIALIVSYILLPKDLNYVYLDDINCVCERCNK